MIYISVAWSAVAFLLGFQHKGCCSLCTFLLTSPLHIDSGHARGRIVGEIFKWSCWAPTFARASVRLLVSLDWASRPGRLFPVKAMKAEVCTRELGSGQTTHRIDGILMTRVLWRYKQLRRAATVARLRNHGFLNRCSKYQLRRDEECFVPFILQSMLGVPARILMLSPY